VQCAESLRTQAYFDGEVDAVTAANIERHAEHCAECRALLEDLEQMRVAIRRESTYRRAPEELKARIMLALDDETGAPTAVPRAKARHKPTWHKRSFWVGALGGGLGSAAIAATVAFLAFSPLLTSPILDELVAAHVRSLMPTHLIDVVSTDQHTVKPWFAGHADVSPVVADFTQQGYRLVGGRADYFEQQRAAVVVYQHGPHVINVFSWAANQHALPKNTTRNGYRMVFWRAGNLDYCAVSDTGRDELLGLVRLLQELSARDPQG
jgi:anti-sigma factor RsiW